MKEPENQMELLNKGNLDLEEYIHGPQQNVNLNENKTKQGIQEDNEDDKDKEDESTDEEMEDNSTYAPSDSSLVSIQKIVDMICTITFKVEHHLACDAM